MSSPGQSVTIKIVGGPTVNFPWSSGMTAHQGLEAAYNQLNSSSQFTYGLQYYGPSLGYLVFMINETYDTFISMSHPFFYWDFLVNGVPASKGVDNIVLQPGDVITFSFETYDATVHANSLLRVKHEFQTKAFARA